MGESESRAGGVEKRKKRTRKPHGGGGVRNSTITASDGRTKGACRPVPSACCFGARLLTRPPPPLRARPADIFIRAPRRLHRRFSLSRSLTPRMCCAAVRRLFVRSLNSLKEAQNARRGLSPRSHTDNPLAPRQVTHAHRNDAVNLSQLLSAAAAAARRLLFNRLGPRPP